MFTVALDLFWSVKYKILFKRHVSGLSIPQLTPKQNRTPIRKHSKFKPTNEHSRWQLIT